MAKVFRIHKEGSGNIIDWAHSHSYGDNVIKQITDRRTALFIRSRIDQTGCIRRDDKAAVTLSDIGKDNTAVRGPDIRKSFNSDN